ncbi:MAG TPA: hypothetical protein PKX85_07875, partial [Candidatus Hydrogenedentes bacterium]|nr:hypothetical protein [Candidatus Hydrogenedentota bacterium]
MNRQTVFTRLILAAFTVLAPAGALHAATSTVDPADFAYLGAFRLPGDGERPETFGYGGNAMTFNPQGDPAGDNDGFPGSLFVMGHERLPYGELPNGNQIAEVSIPRPVAAKSPGALPQAAFIQPFRDAARGLFTEYCEIPRVGMALIADPATGPKLHLAWGQHFHEDAAAQGPTHAWLEPGLDNPNPQGAWHIGHQSLYSVNGYLFEIPREWADAHTGGRRLATGRYRDGGWSGQGPALFAYQPWTDDGAPAAPGTRLKEIPLLLYRSSRDSEDVVNQALRGYQHADEWEGGAWLTTSTGKSAVLFAGTKGVGAKYWYGWVNPAGPEFPCVETEFVGQFTVCRNADGTPCSGADLQGCANHNDFRGWWSSRMEAWFIL